ncbi:MAG: hypothetical protein MZU91_15150 [Desulfosudis oleivorans]|nr:hypothetical protein [Desulfosudis oleivorans]
MTFEDMELPEEYLIGGLNKGVAVLTSGLCTERITLSGCTLGVHEKLPRALPEVCRRRESSSASPSPPSRSIQEKLANMYCGYKASSWMAYSAAAYCDTLTNKSGGKGTDLDRMAAASLLYCGEMGTKIGLDAVQIHGGYGYCTEYACDPALPGSEAVGNRRRHLGNPPDDHRPRADERQLQERSVILQRPAQSTGAVARKEPRLFFSPRFDNQACLK